MHSGLQRGLTCKTDHGPSSKGMALAGTYHRSSSLNFNGADLLVPMELPGEVHQAVGVRAAIASL
jgi:hypothetical protein